MQPDPIYRPPPIAHRSVGTGAIAALVLISALGNFAGTLFFWEMSFGKLVVFSFFSALGLMVAQPCALAVWCALGSQKLVVRAPLTMGILFCLLCEYAATLYMLDNRIPLEITIIVIVCPFVLTALIQIPLWIFRFKTGSQISAQGAKRDSVDGAQFGIKHLLVTTTIAAVIVAVAQYTLQFGDLEGGAPWGEIIGILLTFEIFISTITLLCVAFVFSGLNRIGIGTLLGVVIVLGPIAVNEILFTVAPGGRAPDQRVNIYGFTASLTTALTAVMFAFYGMGYRLQRSRD